MFVLSLVFSFTGFAFAQIPISVPDMTGVTAGETILVPINTGEVTAGDAVLSYNIELLYDGDFATATAQSIEGTITPDGWFETYNFGIFGQANFGAWQWDPTDYLAGEGVLIYLEFDIAPGATGTMPLTFQTFIYNSGTPAVVTTDGSITIGGGEPPPALTDLVISMVGDDVMLDWGASTGATSYNIYRGSEAYFDPVTVYDTTTGLTYTDSGAGADGPWFYIVTAAN